jgi:hypothetical protein
MIRNSPRSRVYPATKIGDSAGLARIVSGLKPLSMTLATRDTCGNDRSLCHHVSL